MSTAALGAVSAQLRFDSGRICLNLLATTHPEEQLDSVAWLRAWCAGEGLVAPVVDAAARGPAGGLTGSRTARSTTSGAARRTGATVLGACRATTAADRDGHGDRADFGAFGAPAQHVLPTADTLWLVAFRELRGHVGQLVRGELDGRPATGSLEYVNAAAREAPPVPHAVRTGDGTLVRALHADPGCAALLALLARDAVDLLTDPVARGRLRRCEGDNCPLIYLDASRGRRRRWCSSEACGNRERVARHRRRAALARA